MSRQQPIRKLHLKFEQLEGRQLLAADLNFLHHNSVEPLDVNNDSIVSAIDALAVANALNARGGQVGSWVAERQWYLDVNNDGQLSAEDALRVTNGINAGLPGSSSTSGLHAGSRDHNGKQPPLEFASLDGSGNNREHPEWGSVGQMFARWVEPNYGDGLSDPAGYDWASAREISNIVNASPGDIPNAAGLSDMAWLFGQFIDHDITLSKGGSVEPMDIPVPSGDPHFDPDANGEAFIDFMRSDYLQDDHSVRQQVNLISAFIDGSGIYGSDQERADALRTLVGGRLKTSQGDLMPFNENGLENAGGNGSTLFLAGDIRANENAALSAMHTIWVREHNRVAQQIAEEHVGLSDEEIYQRARRYVVAELQAITYNEFLPALLGKHALDHYRGYDPTVDPTISNIFATAAYRFGHSMLSSQLLRLDADGGMADEGALALKDAFFNPTALTEHGIDSILRGVSSQVAQEVDPFVVDDVRNFLFGDPGSGGFDLAALNIQRGRDHGLADYNQVRISRGLAPAETFADISSDPQIQARLAEAYSSVDSVDAWVGMLAEDHVRGSNLGATATEILADQFARLRDGDRFYFENVFSGRTLSELRRTSLADVIERNSDIEFKHRQNVFYA